MKILIFNVNEGTTKTGKPWHRFDYLYLSPKGVLITRSNFYNVDSLTVTLGLFDVTFSPTGGIWSLNFISNSESLNEVAKELSNNAN